MLDAVRAEALKLRRHRATWMMVWIYPIAVTLIVAGVLIYGAFRAHGVPAPAQPALEWIRESTTLWKLPASPPGRFLIAGFCAVVFAGECGGWNTWKPIIPARARWQLIAAKWVVALGFLTIALIAADLITLIGSWLGSFQGDGIPAGVTLAAVLEAQWQAGAHALLPIVYTIAFAGLFAMLTQSILATVILSIALVVIEGLWPLIGLFLHQYGAGADRDAGQGAALLSHGQSRRPGPPGPALTMPPRAECRRVDVLGDVVRRADGLAPRRGGRHPAPLPAAGSQPAGASPSGDCAWISRDGQPMRTSIPSGPAIPTSYIGPIRDAAARRPGG